MHVMNHSYISQPLQVHASHASDDPPCFNASTITPYTQVRGEPTPPPLSGRRASLA